MYLVLSSARDIQVSLNFPRFLSREELRSWEFVCVRSADVLSGSSQFQQVINLFSGDTVLVQDVSVRSGNGDDLGAQLIELCSSSPGYITETGDGDFLALELFAAVFQHFSCEEYDTVSGSFCSSGQSAISKTFSAENAFVSVYDPLVLAEQISYLSCAYTYVSGRNIGVRSDMSVKFGHESLTESHDLGVGFSVRVEI